MSSRPITAASPDPDCSGGAGALRLRGGPDFETSHRLPPKSQPSNLQHLRDRVYPPGAQQAKPRARAALWVTVAPRVGCGVPRTGASRGIEPPGGIRARRRHPLQEGSARETVGDSAAADGESLSGFCSRPRRLPTGWRCRNVRSDQVKNWASDWVAWEADGSPL